MTLSEDIIVVAIQHLNVFTQALIDKDPENKRIHNRNLIGAKLQLLLKGGYVNEI